MAASPSSCSSLRNESVGFGSPSIGAGSCRVGRAGGLPTGLEYRAMICQLALLFFPEVYYVEIAAKVPCHRECSKNMDALYLLNC